jgi:DNA-directed RNA polymerase subunit beta'
MSQNILVEEGEAVKKGQKLTEGNEDPQDILDVLGIEAVQKYLVDGIQEVYRSQGVSINNKHIEVILRRWRRSTACVSWRRGTAPSWRRNWSGWPILRKSSRRSGTTTGNFWKKPSALLSAVFFGASRGRESMEALFQYKDQVITEEMVRRILLSENPVTELYVEDAEGPLRVVVGRPVSAAKWRA